MGINGSNWAIIMDDPLELEDYWYDLFDGDKRDQKKAANKIKSVYVLTHTNFKCLLDEKSLKSFKEITTLKHRIDWSKRHDITKKVAIPASLRHINDMKKHLAKVGCEVRDYDSIAGVGSDSVLKSDKNTIIRDVGETNLNLVTNVKEYIDDEDLLR